MSTPVGYTFALILYFGSDVKQSHCKTYRPPPQYRRFCRQIEADKNGEQDYKILFPVFVGEMATAKIQTGKEWT